MGHPRIIVWELLRSRDGSALAPSGPKKKAKTWCVGNWPRRSLFTWPSGRGRGRPHDSRSGDRRYSGQPFDQRYSLALSEGESDECLLLEFVGLG